MKHDFRQYNFCFYSTPPLGGFASNFKKTFTEYFQQQEQLIDVIAQIIAEAETNEALNQILIKEGFWGDLGKNVLWAGSRLARGVKRGVGDFFQGAAKGAKSGWSGVSWED